MEDVTRNSAAEDFAPEKAENLIEAARKEWREATAYVIECEKVLAKAKSRLSKAGLALHESRPQQSLHALNAQQRKITKTESNRRIRVQETLDNLATNFNVQRRSHPPLFEQSKPKE